MVISVAVDVSRFFVSSFVSAICHACQPLSLCISQESNPGHMDGNDAFCHLTTDANTNNTEGQRLRQSAPLCVTDATVVSSPSFRWWRRNCGQLSIIPVVADVSRRFFISRVSRLSLFCLCCARLSATVAVHQPGIEPGSHGWQRCILPLDC